MNKGVWAIAEQRDGEIRKVTYEIVSEGRRIADNLGQKLSVVLLGSNIKEKANEISRFGADAVIVADDPRLDPYTTDAYVEVIHSLVKEQAPAILLTGASFQGKDLSARLSAKLDVGLAMDCTALSIEGGELTAVRPVYAGKAYAKIKFNNSLPQMAAVRPNVMTITETGASDAMEVIDANVQLADERIRTRVVEVIREKDGKVDLTEAEKIVAGGKGMKGGEQYNLLDNLADAIGASVGASRFAVDSGWRPHSDQIGQTGKVVSPNLYIACGISGAIQHMAGVSTSKVIVAINKDPEAPIFRKADYGVVDDLFKVVPLITEEIKKVSGGTN